jgi:hypothetical protein
VSKFWEHAVGVGRQDPAPPAEPFECTLENAQDWCNFVVLRPEWLPPECRLTTTTVRAETLRQPSSLRMTVEGRGRSLRVKQFYMDWWVPTSSDANLTAPGRAFVAAGIVGYLGRDYKGRDAACIHRYGSLLELSATEGHFGDAEIQAFFDRLQPQAPESVRELAALPFARISYHARKGPGQGPSSYDLLSGCRWSADAAVLRKEFDASKIYYPQALPSSFGFDSVGTRHDSASRHWEYQLLFRNAENLTDNIWVRAVGEETEKIVWIAPGLDRRMGIELRPMVLKNRQVRVGSTSEPYGERVAQWTEQGVAFEVHARASLRLSEKDFVRFLDSLSVGMDLPSPRASLLSR